MTEKKKEEAEEVVPPQETKILVGPDIMQDLWEIVRSNRAAGRPSMARLTCTDGGAKSVQEVRIPKREEEQRQRNS